MRKRIAFYIVSGSKYTGEALCSANSLKKVNPEVEIHLFTPDKVSNRLVFDSIHKLPDKKRVYWYHDLYEYIVMALDTLQEDVDLLYLDSDTYFCSPVDEMFEMLERFDFVGAHAPGRITMQPIRQMPESFPEFNIGVLLFRNVKKIHRLFRLCCDVYGKNSDYYKENDQVVLREVLWHDCKLMQLGTLGPEWNCRCGFGAFVSGPVRVLHQRDTNPEKLCVDINKRGGMRLWKQKFLH